MSDEVQLPLDEQECSMCGRTGGPAIDCQLCKGDPRFLQHSRHYTLSEERSGKNPHEAARRYGSNGSVGPERVVSDVVLPKQR